MLQINIFFPYAPNTYIHFRTKHISTLKIEIAYASETLIIFYKLHGVTSHMAVILT
jgi:hypothetical protein